MTSRPGCVEQDLEHLVLARRQVDGVPSTVTDVRRDVHPEVADLDRPRRSAAGPAARRRRASIRARSSTIPNGLVT